MYLLCMYVCMYVSMTATAVRDRVDEIVCTGVWYDGDDNNNVILLGIHTETIITSVDKSRRRRQRFSGLPKRSRRLSPFEITIMYPLVTASSV